MSDDIRTRIAKIIGREIHADDPDEPCQWCLQFADTFVKELDLSNGNSA